MANVHIDDDVLRNILARLPGKSLLRFRCASKHWNRLISDPCFMKSRSRRMVLLPFSRPLVVIDNNEPVENKVLSIPSPLKHEKGTHISVIGTLNNGIVVLALHDTSLGCQLILYNPLTSASKILVDMDPPSRGYPYVFGFCYGDDDHDLKKIFRFEAVGPSLYQCDAFDLKTSSWSMPPYYFLENVSFKGEAGVFVDGVLYWSVYYHNNDYERRNRGILALNVKEMEFSELRHPIVPGSGILLGSLDGCLCMLGEDSNINTFNLWLMKKEEAGKWLKTRSFNIGSALDSHWWPISILGDHGKVLFLARGEQVFIYDTSKEDSSYKVLNVPIDDFINGEWTFGFKKHQYSIDYPFRYACPIEYQESLVSPSDMCFI